MPIQYLKGDATRPQISGPRIIAQVVNTQGGWGRGFVLAVSERWEEPEYAYRRWHASKEGFELGMIQVVEVAPEMWVCNMLAQQGYLTTKKNGPPIRYEALRKCLVQLNEKAVELGASVCMPRIGCGLAGGSWDVVGPMIEETLNSRAVYVYDL